MTTKLLLKAAMPLLTASAAFAQTHPSTQPATGWESRLCCVTDDRSAAKDITTQPFSAQPRLELRLLQVGPEARSVSARRIVVDEATDDVGDDLVDPDRVSLQFEDVSDVLERNQFKGDPRDGVATLFYLKGTPRNATRLTRLRGKVYMHAGGNERSVLSGVVRPSTTQPVADPVLDQAGVKVSVLSAAAEQQMVEINAEGASDLIRRVELVDAAGHKIGGDSSSFGPIMGSKEFKFEPDQKLAAGTRLKIVVAVGQHDISVPFDLKDVPLP